VKKLIAIKMLRKAKKLTQEQFAEKLNTDRSTIAKWETGKSKPKTSMLPLIAEVLECTINDLFKIGG
jgi:transcriptional regulator with XRE-family HTH domain